MKNQTKNKREERERERDTHEYFGFVPFLFSLSQLQNKMNHIESRPVRVIMTKMIAIVNTADQTRKPKYTIKQKTQNK